MDENESSVYNELAFDERDGLNNDVVGEILNVSKSMAGFIKLFDLTKTLTQLFNGQLLSCTYILFLNSQEKLVTSKLS